MKQFSLATSLGGMGLSLAFFIGTGFGSLANAGQPVGPEVCIPLPDALYVLGEYCVDPEDHIGLSQARAECDSEALEAGYPHGFLRPTEVRKDVGIGTPSCYFVCGDQYQLPYYCIAAGTLRRHLPPEY